MKDTSKKYIYAYLRISTQRQSLERQRGNIKRVYPDAVVIEEVYSGTKIERPQFQKLLKIVKEGDTIVFDSVSRMSRNAEEGVNTYKELYDRGVELVFLKEPHINTETYKRALSNNVKMTNTAVDSILRGINEYLLALAEEQIKIAFEQSEKEVKDLQQRTSEGLRVAKMNGKRIGTPKGTKLTTKKSVKAKESILKYSKEFNGNLNDVEVIKLIGVNRNTYYKYKKQLKEENELIEKNRIDMIMNNLPEGYTLSYTAEEIEQLSEKNFKDLLNNLSDSNDLFYRENKELMIFEVAFEYDSKEVDIYYNTPSKYFNAVSIDEVYDNGNITKAEYEKYRG